ncbi:MAG: hypothetical protein RSB77_05380 [Bacilli bacterium]|uniref:hypothetical protein n=1 Tax=Cetobacterium sp. TaxID=2071632 RepID=UPI002FC61DB5
MNTVSLESYKKVIALEKYFNFKENNIQLWYIERIKKGKYTFFAEGDSNWDYYKDENNYIYSISKVEGASSSHFGDLNYYNKRMLERSKNLLLTKKLENKKVI